MSIRSLRHELAVLRSKTTSVPEFRKTLRRASIILATEVSKDLPLKHTHVETPLAKTRGHVLAHPILPAIGQGALAIEIREGDDKTHHAAVALDHPETRAAVLAERSLLATLRGGCLAPVGAWGRVEVGQLRLDAVVLSPDGRERKAGEIAGRPGDAADLGRALAKRLLADGAGSLIAMSRESPPPPATG